MDKIFTNILASSGYLLFASTLLSLGLMPVAKAAENENPLADTENPQAQKEEAPDLEFLKRLFAIVDCWRKLFEDACGLIGQNSKYGLFNLWQARLHYPQIPAVFYTRKSLINDAVAIFKAGADGLFVKPNGHNDDDTRRLTREYAPCLLSDLREIMRPD